MVNNISVGWHLLGVAIVIGLLIFVPDRPPERPFRLHRPDQQQRRVRRLHERVGFWLFVLPIGFLLTMYTETGYDASAHTAEETQNAAVAAAQGIWRSIFYSAIIGWILLLAFLFAATTWARSMTAPASSGAIFTFRWIHGRRSSRS